MLIDPIQMVGDDAEQRGLRGCGHFSDHDAAAAAPGRARQGVRARVALKMDRGFEDVGFRVVRTMYPPTSGHESTASRHAP
jgi:hypothetical protein